MEQDLSSGDDHETQRAHRLRKLTEGIAIASAASLVTPSPASTFVTSLLPLVTSLQNWRREQRLAEHADDLEKIREDVQASLDELPARADSTSSELAAREAGEAVLETVESGAAGDLPPDMVEVMLTRIIEAVQAGNEELKTRSDAADSQARRYFWVGTTVGVAGVAVGVFSLLVALTI